MSSHIPKISATDGRKHLTEGVVEVLKEVKSGFCIRLQIQTNTANNPDYNMQGQLQVS